MLLVVEVFSIVLQASELYMECVQFNYISLTNIQDKKFRIYKFIYFKSNMVFNKLLKAMVLLKSLKLLKSMANYNHDTMMQGVSWNEELMQELHYCELWACVYCKTP